MPTQDPPDSDDEFSDFFLTESSIEDTEPLSDEFELTLDNPNDSDFNLSGDQVVSLDNDDLDESDFDIPLEDPPEILTAAKPLPVEIPKATKPLPDFSDSEPPIPLSSLASAATGALVCPRCLSNVTKFTAGRDNAGGRSFHCPKCRRDVPLAFAQDFGKHPFTQFSLAGLTGNGKSCFLRGLFHCFNHALPNAWPEFSYEPLSDTDGKKLEEWLHGIQGGPLPAPNQIQVDTVGLRLNGIPGLGTLDLLLFDISGEAFTNVNLLQTEAFHVQRSEVVTLLVSLDDINSNFDLIQLLQKFQLGLNRMGTNAKEKTLLVVLTKGDTLLADDSLPELARDFLTSDVPLEPNDASPLHDLSEALRVWLDQHRSNYSGFVRNAKLHFKDVHYTVISALGFAPTGIKQQFAMQPRNVVSPMVWLLHKSLPEVHLKTEAGTSRYFSLTAALEAANEVEDKCPTIEIGAGRFRITERIVIDRPMNLIGQGKDQTFLVGSPPEALLAVSAPVFRASGISFIREGTEPGHVVMVASTLFDIQNCDFQGGIRDQKQNRLGHGLVVQSVAKGPRFSVIKRCKATKNACGFHFLGQSKVHLENSRGENNQFGLLISGSADAEVVDCTFRENTSGIDVNDAGEVTLQNNACEHNSNHGIYLRGSSQPKLEGNVCKLNEKDGIHVSGGARATITGNKATRNKKAGIRIQGVAATTVKDNTCHRNAECGILVAAAAKQTVVGSNTCTENGTPVDRKKDVVDERKKRFW